MRLPTPTASAATQGQNESYGHRGQTLVGAARGQLWPTPRATDGPRVGLNPTESTKRRLATGKANLPEAIRQIVGGRLNPTWVEWLMGFPIGWTDLKPLEMDKFQQWRRKHGDC